MPANTRHPCRTHAPVLTVAAGGTAMYEVCLKCRRLRRNDTEAESRFHLPTKHWERLTITHVVEGQR